MQPLAFIPSPSQGVWHLGPLPIRAYALMIILGIIVAVWLGERRWTARGGTPGVVVDCAVWAVPFGLVGGRLYHVITDYQRYFGAGRNPVNAIKVWEGGLGIWGAVVLGGIGAWIGCRRRGVSVAAFGDAVAPGIALAQGIGRWGNWWNQELYGRPLHTWWAVEIDPAHRPFLSDGSRDPKYADIATYHPTFLYESLWCVGVALFVIWAGRRFSLTHGRTFALYVAAYTVGRAWIEFLRIDDAHHVAGLRLNDWTALLVFLGAVAYIWIARSWTGPEAVTVTGRYAQEEESEAPAGTEAAEEAVTAAAVPETAAETPGPETGTPESEPDAAEEPVSAEEPVAAAEPAEREEPVLPAEQAEPEDAPAPAEDTAAGAEATGEEAAEETASGVENTGEEHAEDNAEATAPGDEAAPEPAQDSSGEDGEDGEDGRSDPQPAQKAGATGKAED